MDGRPHQERVELELRDYLRVLRRQWLLIVLVVAIIVALGVANVLRTEEIYQARSQVLLDAGFSRTILLTEDESAIPDLGQQVTTEIDLMNSSVVNQGVEQIVGYQPEVDITAEQPADDDTKTRIIVITASAGTASEAATSANDFAQAYVTVRRQMIDIDLLASVDANLAAVEGLDQFAARAVEEIRGIDARIPAATGEELDVLRQRRARLARTIAPANIDDRQQRYRTRIDLLNGALVDNQERSIFKVNLAEEPSAPVTPRPVRDTAVALLIGLGLGVLLAFLRDYYDDSIRTKDDLDRVTGGAPVLGIIPAVKTWRDAKSAQLETFVHPGSDAAEAYRSLRTALEFHGVGREQTLVHVTSSKPGEGKSATSANLAVSLALAGHDVVLVDCDLRRPRLHEFFDLDNSSGLTSVLLGNTSMDSAMQRYMPGLFVLPSGPLPPNPSELLSTGAARVQLNQLASAADYVIVDSPPLLPVTDSVILANHCDTTVVVVGARSTNRRSVNRSLELLQQVDTTVAGMVLNRVRQEATYSYGYGYQYAPDGSLVDDDLIRKAKHVTDDPPVDVSPASSAAASDNGQARDQTGASRIDSPTIVETTDPEGPRRPWPGTTP